MNLQKAQFLANLKGWQKSLFLSLLILGVAILITTIIFSTEPTAQKVGATKKTAMLVDVTQVEKGDFRPKIVATGTVIPARDIVLSSQVSGEVIYVSPSFTPGGFVKKGETLLRIEPSDYVNELEQRKSELQKSEADLQLELGRQKVAEADFRLFNDSLSDDNRELMLRKPQLNTIKAQVKAAEAAVKQAELNMARTRIHAPFNAQIINRNANLGSQVSQGQNLARLVGMDKYWVEVTLPLHKIPWLKFSGSEVEGKDGSEVQIHSRSGWPEGVHRNGKLDRFIGALEDETRMARVLVTIKDPLSQQQENASHPPLMIGEFVEVTLEGKTLSEVVRMNRDYLRQNSTAWVMEDSLLNIRKVKVLFQDEQYAYIDSGLSHQEQVVTTNLSTVVEGSKLRLEQSD